MDEETLEANVWRYADRHGLTLVTPLGSGKDGIVYLVRSNVFSGQTAVKALKEPDAWLREILVYERLRERKVSSVEGFQVPSLVRHAEDLLTFEMTTVKPPFVLDFASAPLDVSPEFPDEVWEQWELDKSEQFGDRWETVQTIIAKFRVLGIYLLDPSPNNIRFE